MNLSFVACHRRMRQKGFKSSRSGQTGLKYGGGADLCLFVARIQMNWTNIDQLMTSCANWNSRGLNGNKHKL